MKILITGANGQLGKHLVRAFEQSHTVIGLGRTELDVTNKEKVNTVISQLKPDIIIHSAAFTAVDQCESDPKRAFEVNGLGTGYVAQAASNINARMFYISSDYVFDGKKNSPYREDDEPNPLSTYGMSKWLGEKLVQKFNNGTIIRTSWLYGHDGKNFVNTMIKLGQENKELKVVNDQIGSPTYINDLGEVIIRLLNKESKIYHVSNTDACTWYEFARTIFEEMGYNPKLILPTTTFEYGARAARPSYSVLAHGAILKENISPPRPWKEALKAFIRKEKG
ncbi:dTDP-4-dehydrorhamnose reductase [Cytobacillus firmus]|uniref:dTDP-4-dehydrorhamnose reductase n=1 Tax=Cytobacillus firmus TaxID=1399 RepID=UPI0018CF47F5|nr:dTDP-4-dehydrorhamnose reductase [Cytobacillus firmus]